MCAHRGRLSADLLQRQLWCASMWLRFRTVGSHNATHTHVFFPFWSPIKDLICVAVMSHSVFVLLSVQMCLVTVRRHVIGDEVSVPKQNLDFERAEQNVGEALTRLSRPVFVLLLYFELSDTHSSSLPRGVFITLKLCPSSCGHGTRVMSRCSDTHQSPRSNIK